MSETTLQEDLATCTRILAMKGLVGMFGHVSAFDPETSQVFLSPGAGADKSLTQADDLFVLDLDGQILKRGPGRVPAEWPIHVATHAARSDALSVVHLHAPFSTLFAIARREFRPVTLAGTMFGVGLPLYEDAGLVSSMDAGHRLVQILGDRRAALLRGHGSVVVGPSIQDALFASLVLEDNARNTLQAASLGEVGSFSVQECAEYQRGRPQRLGDLAWEYFCQIEARWDRQPGIGANPLS